MYLHKILLGSKTSISECELDELPNFFKGKDTCFQKWRVDALLVWALTVIKLPSGRL
jgi:hypothetical protein